MQLGYVIAFVPDVAAAIAFYERAFDLKPGFVSDTGFYGEMRTGTTALGFAAEKFVADGGTDFAPTRRDGKPPALEIAFIADDVPAALKRATDAGATMVKPPEVKPWGQTVAYVRDLNGLLVELCTKMG